MASGPVRGLATAHLMLLQSFEDLKQVPARQVCQIQSIDRPDPGEHVADLHVVNADEVMQAGQIGDEVMSGFEAEDIAHEALGDVVEPPDLRRRRREFYALALQGSLADQRIAARRSLGRHEDDDAIVTVEFQLLSSLKIALVRTVDLGRMQMTADQRVGDGGPRHWTSWNQDRRLAQDSGVRTQSMNEQAAQAGGADVDDCLSGRAAQRLR